MGKVLYIGKYTKGQTSRMRAEILSKILGDYEFDVIDTDCVYLKANRIFRSLAFRYKIGPLIYRINKFIISSLESTNYDLIWVDKAIFISPKTTAALRARTKLLIHFTPDPAFVFHQSKYFESSIPFYDFAITTKIFELEHYYKALGENKTIYCTQGYDPLIHKPFHDFKDKDGVVFIGHHEVDREEILQRIIDKGITVKLAGIKWKSFLNKNRNNPKLVFKGTSVFGEDYSELISSGYLSIGLLSKYIPEQHTTRTFEIPACGTALVTEVTPEILSIFNENEAIFINDMKEVGELLWSVLEDKKALERITHNGMEKVKSGGFDYYSILNEVVTKIGLK